MVHTTWQCILPGMRTLDVEDVPALTAGAAMLGSGGGGTPALAGPLLERAMREHGPLRLLAPSECDGDVVLAGAVGSPTVMLERLPSGPEFGRAVDHLAERGAPVGGVVTLEIGGVNGLFGALAALTSGRPLLDADGMGRAFPRLEQCLLHGLVTAEPAVLALPGDGLVTIEGVDNRALPDVVRSLLPVLGGWAAVALYRAPASLVRERCAAGSVSRALSIGEALLRRERGELGDSATLEVMDATAPFAGTVLDVRRESGTSPAGVVTLQDEGDPLRTIRVDFSHDYVSAVVDGVRWWSAPDVVCLVDARSWSPVPVTDVAAGQRLRLLCLPAAQALRDRPTGRDLASYGYVPDDEPQKLPA